jgi:protein-disulfide isomerase
MSHAKRLAIPVGPRDHSVGRHGAPATLVEYGDYECPHCGDAYPVVKDIMGRLGGEVRFVFRHFPLGQIHPHAVLAAQAAEAAGLQGRFWEMHDALFENQGELELEELLSHARRLGLSMDLFQAALQDDGITQRVRDDFRSGVRSGVNGTPGFFINGVKYEGPWEEGSLESALTAAAREPAR